MAGILLLVLSFLWPGVLPQRNVLVQLVHYQVPRHHGQHHSLAEGIGRRLNVDAELKLASFLLLLRVHCDHASHSNLIELDGL